jgi:hypothetical protein
VNCFAEYCFVDKDGKSIKQGRIHREWQAALDRHKRAMIVAGRGHGKTIQVCQIKPLFKLGRNPNLCGKIVGSNDQQAMKRVKALRIHMERNTDLHRVFPSLKRYVHKGGRRPREVPYNAGEWNLGSLTVTGRTNHQLLDPSIQAKSVLASISGDRSDFIIWDDAADRKNSIEHPKLGQKIVEGVDDFINTLHPETGCGWGIGTLWKETDLHHHFMKKWPTYWYEILMKSVGAGVYKFGSKIVHPGKEPIEDWNRTLWSYWNQERLQERLNDIGLRKFMRGFGNRPMAQDEIHVDPGWIEYFKEPPGKDWPLILSIDSASTKGAKSNWTGFCLLAVNPVAAKGLIPASHHGAIKCPLAYHRKLTAPEKVREVERLYANLIARGYTVGAIAIENRGGGQELMDYLIEHGRIPRKLIQPVRPVSSKTDRVDRISHYIENGTVQFALSMEPGLGGSNFSEEDGNVISELVSIPLGEYDDLADAFSMGMWVAILKYKGLKGLASAALDDLDEDDPMRSRVEYSGGSRLIIV